MPQTAIEHDESLATLAKYVPGVIARRLARDPRPPSEPLAEKFSGAVLIADISGFTAMTEALAKRGAIGAELLNGILNDFFSQAIELISGHGGDVVRFAGDALLAAWYGDSEAAGAALGARAAACALAMQSRLHDYRGREGMPLSLKIGIGSGPFAIMHIGGVGGRWEFLVSGPAFVQAFAALDHAAAGQVVASLRAWSQINAQFTGRQLPMGSVLIEAAHDAPVPAVTEPGSVAGTGRHARTVGVPDSFLPEAGAAMAEALGCYVPAAVTSRLAAGQEEWLGELRVASVLFINLPELNHATPLDRAQQIMQSLQQEIDRFEGSINKLNVDDKGTSLLAAMGLPPLAHEDDAKRAVQAALAVQRQLAQAGLRSSIGVSTGRVFCGSIGGPHRREYTLLGDAVNVAARLMQAALGDILCDEATFHMVRGRIEFERFTDILIKGRAQAVAVFRPTDGRRPAPASKSELVGRRQEQDLIAAQLQALAAGAETAVVIVEGEAGIGKSRLVAATLQRARAAGITCLVGAGDSVEASTLYYAWRPVFQELLSVEAAGEAPADRRRHILEQLAGDPELLRLAPLLETLVPCGLTDSPITAAMTGQVRGDNTRSLLLGLLRMAAARGPTLVVLEDAHWQDSASWALASLASRQIPSLLVLLATRPFTQTSPAEYTQLLGGPRTVHLRLDRLSLEDTAGLLARALDVASVPETLAKLVEEKAEGNPLFVEELAYAMREGGLISVEQGQCRLAARLPDWGQFGFPDTLHGVIASRIDRLGTPQQLAVKVASVIGHHFRFRALHDNYPLEGEKGRLREHLGAAERAELIGLESPEPEASYLFRHVIMQQVAYELLPFQQRQQLHRAIAQWYEQSYAGSLAQHYPFLAHHWRHAGEPAKALDYLEKAGETALHGGAYSEAAGFFAEALRLDEEAGLPNSDFRRACWQRQLGEAYLGLGRLPESRGRLEQAIRLLERPPPDTWLRRQIYFLGHAAVQVWRRVVGRRWPALARPLSLKTKANLEAARAYERLAEIYYLSGEAPRLLHALFATLRLSERAGPSAELARAYASNSFTARLLRLHGLARAYGRDALATAQLIGDPVATAWVWGAAGISAIGMGEAAEAQAVLPNAIEIYRQLGDWQHWGECMAMLAQAAYSAGEFQRGLQWWAEAYAMARSRGDRLQQAWGLNGQAEGLLRTGGPEELQQAMAFLQSAVELFTENIDKISVLGSYGWLGVAHLRREDFPAAWQAAESGRRLIREIRSPTAYYMLAGCHGVAATYLGLWEAKWPGDAGLASALPLAGRAREACRALARFARILPVGLPVARLTKGRAAWLVRKPKAAMRAWKAAIRAATRLHMPYEEGLAQLEIARHLPPQHPQRQARLARACELLAAAGARCDLARAEQLRSGGEPPPTTLRRL